MRNIILRVGIALLITNVFASCIEDNAEYNGKCFYYVEGQKIFLQRKENMILIKFSTNTTYEQFTALVGRDTSLQPRSGSDWGSFPEGYYLNPVILETKNGQDIPVATIKSFMNNPEVVSVTYMYLYQEENVLQGITDEFTVKRKSTTSYSQLQKLAKENDCALGEKDWFDDNQHALYVPKSSRLNAMQMSNLFYETGYFEYAEPNMFRWIPDFRFPNN